MYFLKSSVFRVPEDISEQLFYCAELISQLDARMQQIRDKIELNDNIGVDENVEAPDENRRISD